MLNKDKKTIQALSSAIIDLSIEENKQKDLYKDLINLYAFNQEDNSFISFLKNPWLTKKERIEKLHTLTSVFNYAKLLDLIGLLINRNGISLLNDVIKVSIKNLELILGIVHLSIYSVFSLSTQQVEKIKQAIVNKKTLLPSNYTEIITHIYLDANLIGGIKVKINDKVIDNSYLSKLQNSNKASMHEATIIESK